VIGDKKEEVFLITYHPSPITLFGGINEIYKARRSCCGAGSRIRNLARRGASVWFGGSE
jgi:hypothetical protein